jgi:hypothetical protein
VHRLHVVVDVRLTLVLGGHVLVRVVGMAELGVIVFVLMSRAQVFETSRMRVPTVGDVVMAVAVGHGLVRVLLPPSLGVRHLLSPFDDPNQAKP